MHTANASMEFLTEVFGPRIMSGRRYQGQGMDWAPSSPDLSVCDYWLHGYLKVPSSAPLHMYLCTCTSVPLHLHLCTSVPEPLYLHFCTCTFVPAPLYLHLCTCTLAPLPLYSVL